MATAVGTSTGTAVVDFASEAQTIRGFGGADAWMPRMSAEEADVLFGNDSAQQLGLSILRMRIDPAGPSNWGTELANAQAAQQRGAIAIAAPWTPPASMKTNDNVVGGSLKKKSYSAFASYLQSFVDYMQGGGVSLYAISIQNEPDANVTYESCFWTGAQMAKWIAKSSSVITARLMMPESESFNPSYSDPALSNLKAAANIAIVGGHLYGAAPTYYMNALNMGKEVWQTEHYLNGSNISTALEVAKEIHDSMTIASYNAYLWWWVRDWPSLNSFTGLIDASNNLKPAGYAMAQYSKFIRPGYVRCSTTYDPSSSVYVSAYKGNDHFVIVALNLGSSPIDQAFTIQNAAVTSLVPYQTSPSESLAQLDAASVSNGSFTYTLPGQSITTFVQ
jgi:glucuronoarabinoxylan endo-1,4-beta-xylanase